MCNDFIIEELEKKGVKLYTIGFIVFGVIAFIGFVLSSFVFFKAHKQNFVLKEDYVGVEHTSTSKDTTTINHP
jgi:hypothetical protein